MTQPWNTIFYGETSPKWPPSPAAAAEMAPFLEAFHGNTLAEGAVRCQGTLVVHCGSISPQAFGMPLDSFNNTTELLVDSVDYPLRGLLDSFMCKFPISFGNDSAPLVIISSLTLKNRQPLPNCLQDFSLTVQILFNITWSLTLKKVGFAT